MKISITASILAASLGCISCALEGMPEPGVEGDGESSAEVALHTDELVIADAELTLERAVSPVAGFRLDSYKLLLGHWSSWGAPHSSGEMPGDPVGDQFWAPEFSAHPGTYSAYGAGSLLYSYDRCATSGSLACSFERQAYFYGREVPPDREHDDLIYKFGGRLNYLHSRLLVDVSTGHFQPLLTFVFRPTGEVSVRHAEGESILGTIPEGAAYSVRVHIDPESGSASIHTDFGADPEVATLASVTRFPMFGLRYEGANPGGFSYVTLQHMEIRTQRLGFH